MNKRQGTLFHFGVLNNKINEKVPRIEGVCDATNNDSLVPCPVRLLLFYCGTMFLFSAILRNTSSFFKRSAQMITSILLQYHISKRSKQF